MRRMTLAAGIMVVIMLSACASVNATSVPPTEQATQQPTEVVTDAAPIPSGGLAVQGSSEGPTPIAADNLDRLNAFYSLPLPSDISRLAWSPDSQTLAVSTPNGVALFNTSTQAQTATIARGVAVSELLFSPDGKYLFLFPSDRSQPITVWDLAANAASDVFAGKLDGVETVAFSGDGALMATGSSSGIVTVWNLAAGEAVSSFSLTDAGADASGGQPAAAAITFLSDGKTIGISTYGGATEAIRWDFTTSTALPKNSPINHIAGPVAMALFAPNELQRFYWLSRGTLKAVRFDTDQEEMELSFEEFVGSYSFTPDGRLIAVTTAKTIDNVYTPVIALADLASGQVVKVVPLTSMPAALAISPDGTKLAYATNGEGVTVMGIVQNQ